MMTDTFQAIIDAVKKQEYHHAENLCWSALKLQPNSSLIQKWLGIALLHQKKYEGALDALLKSLPDHKNDFDVILHFASIVPTNIVNSNKKKALHVNYHGTKNIVDSINKFSKKKIWLFYSSTSHVYNFNKNKRKEKHSTNPISYYGETKVLGEQYILNNP